MKTGFTLFEIIIVIGIIILVTALAIIPFAGFRDEALIDGAAEDTLALLQEARTRTLSSEGDSRYGVYLESDRITLFKGDSFPGVGDPDNKEIIFSSRLTLLTSGGDLVDGVIFKRLTGELNTGGSITINLDLAAGQRYAVKYRVIELSRSGLINLINNNKGLYGPGDDDEDG
ncbi:MAG: hypothetical protein AAB455_01155 [Patescibacteria group bacterium]